jgi:hypothetical protein
MGLRHCQLPISDWNADHHKLQYSMQNKISNRQLAIENDLWLNIKKDSS